MCLLQHSSVRAKAGMAVWNRSIIMAPATAADTRLGGYRRGLLLPAAVDDDDELASGRGCGAVWLTGLRAIIIIII